MKLRKKEIFVLGVIVTVLSCITLWSGKIEGQEKRYPNKPIEVVFNFAAGGPGDVGMRIITNELPKELGVPVSILYKEGAAGVIGASYIATARPDGYSLLCTIGSLVSATVTEKEPPYDPLKDFTPVAIYADVPNLLITNSLSKLTSFDDLVKFAREKPGALNCATSGINTRSHFMVEILRMNGVDLTHVPTKGGAAILSGLLGNHYDLGTLIYPAVRSHVKAGTLRILGATKKMVQEPGVPNIVEKGFPELAVIGGNWCGFLAPGNLPKPILDELVKSFKKVIQTPSVVTALEQAGFSPEYQGPDEFKKALVEEYRVLIELVKKMGLRK